MKSSKLARRIAEQINIEYGYEGPDRIAAIIDREIAGLVEALLRAGLKLEHLYPKCDYGEACANAVDLAIDAALADATPEEAKS